MTDTIALEFKRDITMDQMSLLRALAMFEDVDSFEEYIWSCIVAGVQADLGAYEGSIYERGLRIIEGKIPSSGKK